MCESHVAQVYTELQNWNQRDFERDFERVVAVVVVAFHKLLDLLT